MSDPDIVGIPTFNVVTIRNFLFLMSEPSHLLCSGSVGESDFVRQLVTVPDSQLSSLLSSRVKSRWGVEREFLGLDAYVDYITTHQGEIVPGSERNKTVLHCLRKSTIPADIMYWSSMIDPGIALMYLLKNCTTSSDPEHIKTLISHSDNIPDPVLALAAHYAQQDDVHSIIDANELRFFQPETVMEASMWYMKRWNNRLPPLHSCTAYEDEMGAILGQLMRRKPTHIPDAMIDDLRITTLTAILSEGDNSGRGIDLMELMEDTWLISAILSLYPDRRQVMVDNLRPYATEVIGALIDHPLALDLLPYSDETPQSRFLRIINDLPVAGHFVPNRFAHDSLTTSDMVAVGYGGRMSNIKEITDTTMYGAVMLGAAMGGHLDIMTMIVDKVESDEIKSMVYQMSGGQAEIASIVGQYQLIAEQYTHNLSLYNTYVGCSAIGEFLTEYI